MQIINCKSFEVDFRQANLKDANFSQTDLSKSLFMHTDLTNADFTQSLNYKIDPAYNKLKNAKFSFPEVIALLDNLDIEINY